MAAPAVAVLGVDDTEAAGVPSMERAHVLRLLEQCHWKINGAGNAADRLGLNPSTLRYRMKKLGIERPAEG